MAMRNTLANHLKVFGEIGRFTWDAGRDCNDSAEIDAESYRASALRKLEPGQVVYIRGTSAPLVIERVNGMFVYMKSYGDRSVRAFREVSPSWGSYVIGRIHIYKGHLVLEPDAKQVH